MAAIRDKAKKFQKFLQGLQEKYAQAVPERELPLLDRFVFYLLAYSNPVQAARKAYKGFTDDKVFASWSEVRVATVREIADVLDEAKVAPSEFLAPRIKEFLQRVFEEVDETSFEPLRQDLNEAENAKDRKNAAEKARKWISELPGIPPWGSTYLLTGLGLESQLPWDPLTEEVFEEQKVWPPKSTLNQKKRTAKALLDGVDDMGLLDAHHLMVEYAKRDLKRAK